MCLAGGTHNRSGQTRHARPALTLVELLVVLAIALMLLSLLLPALNTARKQMRGLQCASKLRTIAFDFQLFAENLSKKGRGDSELLGRNRFYANDFLESIYRIDEFWDQPNYAQASLNSRSEPILCPSGAADIKRIRGAPCGPESLQPAEDITMAINMRLYRAEVVINNKTRLAPVRFTVIRNTILNRPYVPLMIEVDGEEAVLEKNADPFYVAPPIEGANSPYNAGRYWSPSKRHGERTNVAFVGGHVLSSESPEKEAWDWSYQADIMR